MITLETQYQNHLKENSNSILTYEEWIDYIWVSQILVWDNTLMDGLEDEN